MRTALLLGLLPILPLVLAGCPPDTIACTQDSDCAGKVCTRDEECTPANEVRSVRITWTVNGGQATPASCANMPDLFVEVDGPNPDQQIAFAPVPCDAGVFNFDKLPTSYRTAVLGIDGSNTGDRVAIDATNAAHFDLFP